MDFVAGGNTYRLDGSYEQTQLEYGFGFDSAIVSDNGVYAVVYVRLGTKGILLNNGEMIREINRPYYCSDAYEYPIAFLKLPNGEYAIVHCPENYNEVVLESIDSAERTVIGKKVEGGPFFSRLKVNPSGKVIMHCGWWWHPFGLGATIDIEGCSPDSLRNKEWNEPFTSQVEICSCDFLTDDLVVVSATDEAFDSDEEVKGLGLNEIGLFSLKENQFLKKVRPEGEYKRGTLIAIDENVVLDLYELPKLIDLNTGAIVQEFEDINSGVQDSSIIWGINNVPPIAVNKVNKRIAIANGCTIHVLSF